MSLKEEVRPTCKFFIFCNIAFRNFLKSTGKRSCLQKIRMYIKVSIYLEHLVFSNENIMLKFDIFFRCFSSAYQLVNGNFNFIASNHDELVISECVVDNLTRNTRVNFISSWNLFKIHISTRVGCSFHPLFSFQVNVSLSATSYYF